jgi:hypothetical protein
LPEVTIVKLFLKSIQDNNTETFWNLLSNSGQSFLKGTFLSRGCITLSEINGNVPEICKEQLDELISVYKEKIGSGYIDNPGICDTLREDTILRSRILVISEVKCKIDILKETQMIGRHILVIRELMEPQPGGWSWLGPYCLEN